MSEGRVIKYFILEETVCCFNHMHIRNAYTLNVTIRIQTTFFDIDTNTIHPIPALPVLKML